MFYRMYLSSVCNRRQWPDPYYEPWRTRHGHFCKVTVNNREYRTDVAYATEELARDNAAMKAFMICRNFSANDGMYPGQRPGQVSANGVVQGLPVAIGAGRKGNRNSSSSSSDGSSSGGNSPKSMESGFEMHMRQAIQPMPKATTPPRRYTRAEPVCPCGRGFPVRGYLRCALCLAYLD